MRFAVGEAVVDVIVDDGNYELPLSDFLPGLDPDGLARHLAILEPEFLDVARDRLKVAVQSYVVHTGSRTILIDSCVGDDRDRPEVPVWNQRHATGFLDRLRRAGTDPAAVDIVLCTHLHVDHVGWNTRLADGRFVPTFPKPATCSAATSWPTGWRSARPAPSRRSTAPRSRTASSRF